MKQKPFAAISLEVLEYINTTRPVTVYRNLHRNCISVKQDGIVCCHAQNVVLYDATFVVGGKGRQRVLREKQKNVHAFIRGYVKDAKETLKQLDYRWPEITYNPYTCEHFKCVDNDKYVSRAQWVDLYIDSLGSSTVAHNIAYKEQLCLTR